MATNWDFYPAARGQKQLEVFHTRPDPYTGAYGPVFVYDDLPPDETCTISTVNPTNDEVLTEIAKVRTKNTPYEYTMADGTTLTGIPYSYSYKEMDALPLYELTIELRRTDV